ncbi:hypothetical protein CRE_16553 [Caenorhabditis remanei]|uniref:Receptor ligand binding region domain-containing protein n=1 Tax=Caenorhabditis remanei TaxID=31234 RepID=E3NSX3_CAERE|nr:hypothetical protein CRE_16553 [Caenorhabditis remanei]
MRVLLIFFLLLSKQCLAVKVKVAHIGAVGAMKNSEKILQLSKEQLIQEGVLGDDFQIEILNQMGCGESYEGVAVGADMYHVQGVRAFIGPYCNAELDAVAKMATFWNIPIVGYMASSNSFADKSVFKTLARVSLRTTNSLAEAAAALIKHYGWNKVAIATNTGAVAFERVQSFEEVFHQRGINVVRKIMLDEYTNAKAIMNSGLLQELENSARIVVCAFSSTRDMTKEFMQAVTLSGMNNANYAWILPWLQIETKDNAPWLGDDGEYQQNVKDHFANAFLIDDVNGFDNTLVTPFKERLESNGYSTDDLEMGLYCSDFQKNIYGYIHLYDALRLYALAVRATMNETGDENSYLNGKEVWNHMRRISFPGLVSNAGVTSGTVMMDDIAERAPVYAAFYVPPNSDNVRKVCELEPVLLTNCDGTKTGNGCYELQITDLSTRILAIS